jgi:hypothetical protein
MVSVKKKPRFEDYEDRIFVAFYLVGKKIG